MLLKSMDLIIHFRYRALLAREGRIALMKALIEGDLRAVSRPKRRYRQRQAPLESLEGIIVMKLKGIRPQLLQLII